MSIFDDLIILQKESNVQLLNYLLILAKLIFITYSGTLFGSYLLSLYFDVKSKKGSQTDELLSRDYINLITPNKTIAFGLGIVPYVSIIAIYAQLLYNTEAPVVAYLILGFVFFLLALIGAYSYKHSLQLSLQMRNIPPKEPIEEGDIYHYTNAVTRLKARAGIWGFIFLFFSLWILISSSSLAVDNERWATADFLSTLFSIPSIIIYINFITAGLAVTGMAFIVKFFIWDKFTYKFTPEYGEKAQKLNASISLFFMALQPVFLILNLVLTPKYAVSYFMFGFALAVLLISFYTIHIIYVIVRNNRMNYTSFAFYLVILVFFFTIIKEQSAFTVANKQQFAYLADEYKQYETAKLALLGKSEEKIDGEELYKVKCTACHQFEQRLVGPPHKLVLAKYIGKKEELVKFLLNPVKIDPQYPAMPNQALKPKEAEAIADYMFEHYGPMLEK